MRVGNIETPVWLLFIDETLYSLSLHSPFSLFLQILCTILWQHAWFSPQKTSFGILTAYFIAVYKWHGKPDTGKTKRYATIFGGIHRAFSKGLLHSEQFENACLPMLQMLADCDSFTTHVLIRKLRLRLDSKYLLPFTLDISYHLCLLSTGVLQVCLEWVGMAGRGGDMPHINDSMWKENKIQKMVPVVYSVDDVYWVMDEYGERGSMTWSGWNGWAGERRVNQSWDLFHQPAGFISLTASLNRLINYPWWRDGVLGQVSVTSPAEINRLRWIETTQLQWDSWRCTPTLFHQLCLLL